LTNVKSIKPYGICMMIQVTRSLEFVEAVTRVGEFDIDLFFVGKTQD